MTINQQDDDSRQRKEKISHQVTPIDTKETQRKENLLRLLQSFLPTLNSIISLAGVVGVLLGVWVAIETLNSIDESVSVANRAFQAQTEELELSRNQFTATRDSMRLEQRAWLRYAGFTLQTLTGPANKTDSWENREIGDPEEIARFRVFVLNSGQTPALKVTLSTGNIKVGVPDYIYEQPTEWMKPIKPQRGLVVMPGEQGQYMYTEAFPLPIGRFEDYIRGDLQINLWTRLQYCDIYQRRHWAHISLARPAGSDPNSHFTIREQHFGPANGEPNHPECQDIVQATP